MSTNSSSELEMGDTPETPDTTGAYPRLNDEQIMLLSQHGERKVLAEGSTLFCAGDRDCGVFVVLDGKVRVVQEEGPGGEARVIAVHGRGRFVGDLSMLTGQAVYVTAVAQTDVEVLEVLYDGLKEAVTQDQALGDLILRAFVLRRNLHAGLGAGLRIIGSRYSADTRRLRDFASRNRIPYRWEDLEDDLDAEATLRAFDIPPDQTPVVIWKARTVLRNPSNTELAELLGLRAAPSRSAYDLVVVGAGPGGLAAAVYAASEGLSTVVLDALATGGQAATSSQIENYLGFPAGISGAELAATGPWCKRASSAPPSASPVRQPPSHTPTATTWWGWRRGRIWSRTPSSSRRVCATGVSTSPGWIDSSAAASTTPLRSSRPGCANRTLSPSSGVATRRARRPASWPAVHR
ncbi:hypothetical protein GCM10022376_19230 [Yimella lutea]